MHGHDLENRPYRENLLDTEVEDKHEGRMNRGRKTMENRGSVVQEGKEGRRRREKKRRERGEKGEGRGSGMQRVIMEKKRKKNMERKHKSH